MPRGEYEYEIFMFYIYVSYFVLCLCSVLCLRREDKRWGWVRYLEGEGRREGRADFGIFRGMERREEWREGKINRMGTGWDLKVGYGCGVRGHKIPT